MNVGNFISSYWNGALLAIFGNFTAVYYATGACLLAIGVIWTAITFITPTWKKQQ